MGMGPRHALVLLHPQRELDKNLLQLLVAVVYDELLKRIQSKNLKAVNVQHANRLSLSRRRHLSGRTSGWASKTLSE